MAEYTAANGDVKNWSIRSYIQAARDLGYSEAIIHRLKKSKNDAEASRIMKTAREDHIKSNRGWRPNER